VVVDGTFIRRSGRLTRIDEAAILDEICAAMGVFLARHDEVEQANAGLLPLCDTGCQRCLTAPLPIMRHFGG